MEAITYADSANELRLMIKLDENNGVSVNSSSSYLEVVTLQKTD